MASRHNRRLPAAVLIFAIASQQRVRTTAKALHTAQPDRAGNRDTSALDQSLAKRIGARSDRGECAQGAVQRVLRKGGGTLKKCPRFIFCRPIYYCPVPLRLSTTGWEHWCRGKGLHSG